MLEKTTIIKKIELPYGLVELRSDNILTFRPDIAIFKEYDLEILQELLDVFKEITNGIPRPYLCDNRYLTGIVNKNEQAFIDKHFGEFATQMAMITESMVVKILLNSYNSIFKPKVQIKLFKKEDAAVEWLLRK